MSKKTRAVLCGMVIGTASGVRAQTSTPTPDSRRLQDIVVFHDKKSSEAARAAGGASLVHDADNSLPIDAAQVYESLPSLKLETSGDSGGTWQVVFAANDWRTFDLAPYMARGALEFNIKGEHGGETFLLELMGRRPGQYLPTSPVLLSDFAAPTTGWTPVRIPLSAFGKGNPSFPFGDILHLTLRSAKGTPTKVWLNRIRFTSPDREASTKRAIKVNQIGYLPKGEKRAVLSGFEEELTAKEGTPFRVLSAGGREVFTGKLKLAAALDKDISGERVLEADFTSLNIPGEYTLEIAGAGRSPSFRIETALYAPLLKDALRYFYLQRSGMPLEKKYAGQFARGEGHPGDRALRYQSDPDNASRTRDAHGGWYDAGDYGKYVSMAAKPISDLLWAYELFPAAFPDGLENTPESGNKIPDVLDEVRWETDWMMRMQDKASGGFYQKVWPNNGDKTPDKDLQTRYIYDKAGTQGNVRPTAATAAACAALSHTAVLWKPFDAAYSAKLLASAKRGWHYLEAHPENIVARGMTGAVENDAFMRLWAAGELYRADGEAAPRDYFLAHYPKVGKALTSQYEIGYTGDESVLGWLAYLKTPHPDPAAVEWFATRFNRWKGWMEERNKTLVWRNYLNEWNYFWGSNSVLGDTVLLMEAGTRLTGGDEAPVIAGARACLDYWLGTNPLAMSYVSGYGKNSVKHIYSTIWTNDGIDAMPAGYLAGGSNKYEGRVFSNFAGKCYRDSAFEWTTNENAIYWNSVLVFVTALVHSTSQK